MLSETYRVLTLRLGFYFKKSGGLTTTGSNAFGFGFELGMASVAWPIIEAFY